MSNALKKKKLKTGIKYSRIRPDYEKMIDECFYRVFKSLQLCSWYVLYAPEYFDWRYEELQKFSDCMDKNNNAHKNVEFYREEEERFSKEIGFDFCVESKHFPYRAKIKMYRKTIRPSEVSMFVETMDKAVESILFLTIYTLRKDFKMSTPDVKNKFIPRLLEISYEYSAGLTDDTLIKYFKDLSGWDIQEDGKEARIW